MIQKTYWDDNPEDRNFTEDLWSWLQDQPQDAWLLWARNANWDNADLVFQAMIEDQRCDGAVAAFIFFGCEPGFYVRNPESYKPDTLIAKIVAAYESGRWRRSELFINRYELVHQAQAHAAALSATYGASPFRLPRALSGPHDGRRAELPAQYDAQTEEGLAELFHALDGWLPRSEDEHWRAQERGGNLWIKDVFRLPPAPANPVDALSRLDDRAYLAATFGAYDDYAAGRQQIQKRKTKSRRGDMFTLIGLAVFAVVAIGGAMIAHRLRTGVW